MKRSTLDRNHALRNIQNYAALSAARARRHRDAFERTGYGIHKIYWRQAMRNAARFAAIVRREMGNV